MEQSAPSEIFRFEPPEPVYLLDLAGEVLLSERLTRESDLYSGVGVAIRNPWHRDRFVPGKALGEGREYLMDVGESFASIVFAEETGWVCRGLVRKDALESVITSKASLSFTDRLVKRSATRRRS